MKVENTLEQQIGLLKTVNETQHRKLQNYEVIMKRIEQLCRLDYSLEYKLGIIAGLVAGRRK